MSTSAGPYQSRVFNFFLRQSRQLTDKYGQTLRRVKLAATWSIQLVLYPLYVMFQGMRLTGQQLWQRVERVLPRLGMATIEYTLTDVTDVLPQPDADRPIQGVLQAVQALSLPTHSLPSVAIQGIASQLQSRMLVLISDRNEILNILTPAQQHQLRAQMAWGLAHYWQQRRQLQALRRSVIRPLPPHASVLNALPPVWAFRRLMAWMQSSPVAIAFNLFHESALVTYRAQLAPVTGLTHSGNPESGQWMIPARFDYAMARLEAADLSPAIDWLASITQQGQSALQRAWSNLAGWQTQAVSTETSAGSGAAVDVFGLIRAAIAYFFGGRGSASHRIASAPLHSLPGTSDPAVNASQIQAGLPELPSREPMRPRLLVGLTQAFPQLFQFCSSWIAHRLRGGHPPQSADRIVSSLAAVVEGSETSAIALVQASAGAMALQQPLAATSPVIPTTARRLAEVRAIAPLSVPSANSCTVAQTAEPGLGFAGPQSVVAPDPDWIDTEVTVVGYVKHPLERLLDWLDRAMLWLEDWLIRMGHQLRAWWQSRQS